MIVESRTMNAEISIQNTDLLIFQDLDRGVSGHLQIVYLDVPPHSLRVPTYELVYQLVVR